jgi:hypothetical protein
VENRIKEIKGDLSGFTFVEGYVENTIPNFQFNTVCLLRLDTDFYTSTMTELKYIYPKLSPGGVITIDDYGMYRGARTATDEYFAGTHNPPLLNRIDVGIWSGVKPHNA